MTRYFIILVWVLSSLTIYSQNNKTFCEDIKYPYSASEQRQSIIFDNMNKLNLGISNKEVLELLTLPDEINTTYPSNITAKDPIGFSYVYLIERKQENGSVNEKSEKLIRVQFDTKGILISAYAIGVPNFKTIKKESNNTSSKLPGSKLTIDQAIETSRILPISNTDRKEYTKPIIAICRATEDAIEPGQFIVETCYYYHQFKAIETLLGILDIDFNCDYNTNISLNEKKNS